MIELNSIRIALGLTWNEFYLCYFVQDQTQFTEYCPLSRNQLADNLGVSKQAIIDLVKKLDRVGYLVNDSSRLKCTDKWSRNFTDAADFNLSGGKESLPFANSYGKETLPLSNSSDKDSLPVTPDVGKESLPPDPDPVKKVDRYTIDSGKETLPPTGTEVKNLYQQHQEITVQNQEKGEKEAEGGKESLPLEEKSDLYIYTKEVLINKEELTEVEKGCGEKQKSKPFEITTDSAGVSTCQVLRRACLDYDAAHQGLYTPDMYKKFINHWSALKGGKPAWYREKTRTKGTWDLPLRLSTWHQNDLKFNSNSTNGKSNQRSGGALRPTSIAEPSKRTGAGNVAHVEF